MFTEETGQRPGSTSIPPGLLELLDEHPPNSLLVVGDLMLDVYTYGLAERLSPEAPIPVLNSQREEARLGGAANVGHMARCLGAGVHLVGLLGQDSPGRLLIDLVRQHGLDDTGVVVSAGRSTTTKHRFVGQTGSGWQQLLRVDRETRQPASGQEEAQLRQRIESVLEQRPAILVSDYGKGVCSPSLLAWLIAVARQRQLRVLVDPVAEGDYSMYRGATLLKPNRRQAAAAVGRPIRTIQEGIRAAAELADRLELQVAVVTLDRDGLVWFDRRQGKSGHVPAEVREVCDITGAGDMVLAAVGSFYGDTVPLEAALWLATLAAGRVVEQFGVVPVSRQELRQTVAGKLLGQQKIVDLPTAARLAEYYRRQGKRIAFTNGCFDLLHAGHVMSLRAAAAEGDVLFVAINSDASVRRLKGPGRPIVAQDERLAVLAALQCVDHVLLFDEDTPHRLLEAIRPDVLVKGGTYKPEEVVGREVVESYGGQVRVTPVVEGLSTTAIVQKVLQRSAA
ncbi:MAG: bifunctional protein HldE [Pirellulaceae bacterium]|nr:MAG: bifunctional protein HldE [Pirellulaceae bacterium]